MELRGTSETGWAVWGAADSGTGMVGTAGSGPGVWGDSVSSAGVAGISAQSHGVYGQSNGGNSAVFGSNTGGGPGVLGRSSGTAAAGVEAQNTGGGVAVWGVSIMGGGIGVLGQGTHRAALFHGVTEVRGDLKVVGGTISTSSAASRIDHVLEPDNKCLQHSFVQSPDMKNVYDGVQQLGEDGATWVELPEWFGELNKDYRYQLTPVGGPAPDLHVAEEIYGNRFKIAGGMGGMKISWQVTGIRKDKWAEENRVEVEIEKPEDERVTEAMGGAQRPPQPPELPPQLPPLRYPMPLEPQTLLPSFHLARLEEEHRRQIDDLRRQIEELRRR